MKTSKATNLDRLASKVCKNFRAPEKLTVSEWADKYRVLSQDNSAESGRWRTTRTPYLREPMDAVTDPNITNITMIGPSQFGKTEFLLNVLGYIIDVDPKGVLYILPTQDQAQDFSIRRLAPFIKDNPRIRRKIAPSKTRSTANSIRKKAFPGGMVTLAGSNTPNDLASAPCRYVLADEVDRWAKEAGSEGDPLGIVEARMLTFYNRKMIAVTSPTIAGQSKGESLFILGTQEYYQYRCPKCKHYHKVSFSHIKFGHSKEIIKGKVTHKVDWVQYECPECQHRMTEEQTKAQPAKWVAENPEAYKKGHRSFWFYGFGSPWMSWEYIVRRFLEAGKDPSKLKPVWNTIFGELYEDRGDTPAEEEYLARRELYEAELPDGALFLTCGVDTQDNRLEYEVVGWGYFNESWGIKRGIIYGRPDNPDTWRRLDDVVQRQYKRKDGKALQIGITLVDSGGHFTNEVYRACRNRAAQRVFAIKGAGDSDINSTMLYTSLPKLVPIDNNPAEKTWLYTLGVNKGKRFITDFLKVKEPGEMYCHFPLNEDAGYNEAYFNGLLSEVEVIRGNRVEWKKLPGHERNEPFDLRNYAFAGLKLVDPDMDAQYKRIHNPAPEPVKNTEQRPRANTSNGLAFESW